MNTSALALVATLALSLSGCIAMEATDAEYPVVQADDAPVVVPTPPPEPVVEVAPASVPGRVWVPGYWWWGPRGYAWYRGRYVIARPGAAWVGPRYVFRGGVHYYYGARWVRR